MPGWLRPFAPKSADIRFEQNWKANGEAASGVIHAKAGHSPSITADVAATLLQHGSEVQCVFEVEVRTSLSWPVEDKAKELARKGVPDGLADYVKAIQDVLRG